MSGKTYKFYGRVVRVLKKHLPPAFPVSVRRTVISKKYDGRCWKHGKNFYIEIARDLDEWKAVDVLLHEWAHALAWTHRLDAVTDDEEFNKLSHDGLWGVSYAEVYSLYEKHFASHKH